MALTLLAIERNISRKTGKPFYTLYCADDYDNKRWLCGSPLKVVDCSEYVLFKALGFDVKGKTDLSAYVPHAVAAAAPMVGKTVYVMYNEMGYTSYIKFYDEDEQKQTAGAYYSAPPEPPAYTSGDYPFN